MRGGHSYFKGAGDIRLHYRCWEVPTPRAVVIVCHGLGEHSGRYKDLAQDFARAGLSTYALDHRGHGRSDGRKGHVRRFVRYIHDLEKFRRRVVGAVGTEVPLIFLGHSLGGLILIRYLQEYAGIPARGAVLSAPLLGVAVDVPQWKEQLARALYYTIPALPMSSGLDPQYLSHDVQVIEAYKRDALVHDRVTPRLYGELQREIGIAFQQVDRLRVPMLMLIPSADKLARPDLMQRFSRSLTGSAAMRVKTYPGLYHEVLNEATRSSVVADLLGWIERHISGYAHAQSNTGESAG